jgi:YfiR/HmsC-like
MSRRLSGAVESSGPIPGTPRWEPPSSAWNRRSIVSLTVLLLTLFAPGAERTRGQSNDEEYRVKAAFLFHFAQLVDWPAEPLSGTDNSLSLCTLGEDPFQGTLEGTVAGKAIGNRTIRVRHLFTPQDLQACQIIFLGKAQSKRIPTLVADLHNAPILTVGETAGFLDAGGMICFLLQENKVRFEINLNAADSAKLKIGSRLLILAQRVVGESHGK